ncbi:MAG: hypothetical protein DMG65_24995 [Candidatus Angelobacter sp. Gp1-AA117]|nr:MAG: hypothetical protein DMG65_24995 [Candidatus Angelobacter sp. Gp1-AA117]
MKWMLPLLLALVSCVAVCQECTSYVIVNAFDHKTTMNLNSLRAENLEARLGTTALPVVSAEPISRNRILFLVEISGNDEDRRISQMLSDAVNVARQAPDGQPIAFGIFAEKALFTDAFFPNAQQRKTSIDAITAQAKSLGKHTALYDALHEGLALFGAQQPGDTLLLMSDGVDNRSKRSDGDLEKEFFIQGVRLWIVPRPQSTLVTNPYLKFNSYRDNMSWRATPGRRSLMALASETGGGFLRFPSPLWLDAASAGFVVGVKPPADLNKPKPWKLEARKSSDWANGKPDLWYPSQLPPCSGK